MWLGAWMASVAPAGAWRGGAARRGYSVVVFIVLASLDNVAIGLVPPLYSPIGAQFHVSKQAVGLVTAVSFLVTAIAAVGWAYTGDRTNRKPLLMLGTTIWAAGLAGSALAGGYAQFFVLQMLAAVGLGAVASVGFSVVSDLISPRRRGLVMSLWGLSQGIGTLAGTAMGGLLGAGHWRRPFLVLAVLGLVATAAYFFTADIRRGQSEPALAEMFANGEEYEYRISRDDLGGILARRTNLWLVLQGLTAQVTFGSLVWLPQLLQARAQAQGYPEDTAIVVGSVFAVLFQLGGVLAILGGLVGDRLQRRTPRGRALVAAVGILAGIPFYLVLFFVPLKVHIPAGAGRIGIVQAVLASVVTEPTVAVSFLAALLALALTSANSPNWFALLADVNPPEHRGTVYSLGNLANGVGRAAGNGLLGLTSARLIRALPPPLNYATALALFQVFFIPTGIMYYLASRTAPRDIEQVRETLRGRAPTSVKA
ncbi:MAG: transporter, Spinster family, sphingosine-phosphate transporter [Micromonosporaceae bacterium]